MRQGKKERRKKSTSGGKEAFIGTKLEKH